jgi:hypothetical protein
LVRNRASLFFQNYRYSTVFRVIIQETREYSKLNRISDLKPIFLDYILSLYITFWAGHNNMVLIFSYNNIFKNMLYEYVWYIGILNTMSIILQVLVMPATMNLSSKLWHVISSWIELIKSSRTSHKKWLHVNPNSTYSIWRV